MIVTSETIILHQRKYSESSKILAVYTRDYGLCSLMAKGARRPKSKFGTALDPLSVSRVSFIKKPGTDLFVATDAEHSIRLKNLANHWEAMVSGLMIAETILSTQQPDAPNPELYDHIVRALELLNDAPSAWRLVFPLYLCALANHLGITPAGNYGAALAHCKDTYYLSIFDGQVRSDGVGFCFSHSSLEVLSELLCTDISAESLRIEATEEDLLVIEGFLVRYISHHLDRELLSRTGVLRQELSA